VSTAISLLEGRVSWSKWTTAIAFSFVGGFVNTSLALVGVIITYRDARAALLLLVPASALYVAYQAYNRERQKTERIEFLYESGKALAAGTAAERGIVDLLQQSRHQFHADVAEVTISGIADEPPWRTATRGGEVVDMSPAGEPGAGAAVLEAVMARDKGMIISRATEDAAERQFLEDYDLHDAMVTTLKADNRVIGTMHVGNRLGVMTGFDGDDLNLLATLANQVGVAVENNRLERVLHHQAYHDSLTNLANRALFVRRLEEALGQADHHVGVLLVDIDDFKVVNDTMGHMVGDQLLVTVAERLTSVLRASDTPARLGGDEFAVLIEDIRAAGETSVAAERILEALREPFELGGQLVRVRASIGIGVADGEQLDSKALLIQADVAMYAAKRQSPGSFRVFEASMQDEVAERHALREDLRLALERGELVNYYQPLVSLNGGSITGAEALVRWHHPTRGLVPPLAFIPIAEESGLIIELGRDVLRQACRQAREWKRLFPENRALSVSVNLSAVQLRQAGFVDEVVSILKETDLDPKLLTLEITESTFMDDARTAIARLRELRGLGIHLELDDFGTGYSSMSVLRDLPLDGLKIDKSFVDTIHGPADRPAFMQAIVRLAQALNLEMVGEGIEHEAQAHALAAMGCQSGQGYLFSKPVTAAELEPLLRASFEGQQRDERVVAIPTRRRSD
jgi:diguanylate cyclase (GGDEF)-like protein